MRIPKHMLETMITACEYALQYKDASPTENHDIKILHEHMTGKLIEMNETGQDVLYVYGRPPQ